MGMDTLSKQTWSVDVAARNMLEFVGNALAGGKNVMVHCSAGAHRAGTTGVICLLHFHNLSSEDAIAEAQSCRPVIDPTFDRRLPRVLRAAEEAKRRHRMRLP